MTARTRSSVRMGPITLLVLVVVLCLAVLTVLSLVTARSQQAVTQQQAATVEAGYRNEVAAETFLAQLDGILAQGRSGALTRGEVDAQIANLCGEAAGGEELIEADDPFSLGGANAGSSSSSTAAFETAHYDATQNFISATFKQEGGRKLDIEVEIKSDFTYAVLAWKATTEWTEPGMGNMLWEG